MSEYIIQDTTLNGIADAIRDMRKETGTMTPSQMISKINDTKLQMPVNVSIVDHTDPVTGKWVRPQGYPDLDTVEIGDNFDGVYLTYDLTKTPSYAWIGLYVKTTQSGGVFSIDRGHLSNGEFVVDDTNSVSTGSYFRQALDTTNGDVQLWRITATKSIERVDFATNTSGSSSTNFYNNFQPCVERVGRLDYMIPTWGTMGTSPTNTMRTTVWLERDAIKCKCLNTGGSLNGAWSNSWNLQSLEEIENWAVENWSNAGLQGTWSACYSLKKLDLSNWDTSNWHITNMSSLFANCYSLQELDVSTWNTSNWAVTNLYLTWSNCYSLKKLDISNWNTSNWAVTRIDSTWYNCNNLQVIDVSNWDVSNWAVYTLQQTWYGCYSLQELDLSSWDVSNWVVTSFDSTWSSCYTLKKLDISTWDVSGWAVTKFNSTFYACESLKVIPIEDWDVSNWAVTSLASTFYYCFCLEELDLSSWDVSGWQVTTLTQMFYNCNSLKKLDISTWDVSGWDVTTMAYFLYYPRSLKELDLSSWDISNWSMSATDAWNYWIRDGYALETLKLPSNWLKGGNGTNQWKDYFYCLRDFTGMATTVNHSYDGARRLTPQSVINILNALPTVTSSKTITLGAINKLKVSASDIAVATQKGWTVA